LKILINRKPKYGPWGGGIKTVNKLVETLTNAGHEVVFKLVPYIDVIFCIDPRPNEYGEWYQSFLDYKTFFKNVKIIQRVGDLGTHSKPELTELVRATLPYSDFLIFPSEWARDWIGFSGDNCEVIHNSPIDIFHEHKERSVSKSGTIRLVTHHWSMNPKKGFDVYNELQKYIDKTKKYEFTYIGRKPNNCRVLNYIPPTGADVIAKELPRHDIYVTASKEEAGANHVLEAMAAGLPVVFHKDGGSIVNYCDNYGLSFSSFAEMISKIDEMYENYAFYKKKVLSYNKDNSQVIDSYIKIISNV
jgi:glycosyltransferase involved in cell wall biosynthesis|tara:strand:- start:962 stop:1870 length:909 start_codon:yes stop_codon:yes gene_type:complete